MVQQNSQFTAQSQYRPQMQQQSPEPKIQQQSKRGPEKKKNWSIWAIILMVIITVAGIVFYLLKG